MSSGGTTHDPVAAQPLKAGDVPEIGMDGIDRFDTRGARTDKA